MWATRIALLFVLLYVLRCVHERHRVRGGTCRSRRKGLLRFSPNRTKLRSRSFEKKKNQMTYYRLFLLHFSVTNEPLGLFL